MTHQILAKVLVFVLNFLLFYFSITLPFELFNCFFPCLELCANTSLRHNTVSRLSLLFDNYISFLPFFIYVLSASMRQTFFNHLVKLLCVKFYLGGLIEICKSHPIWNSWPSMLVSHVEGLKRQIRVMEGGIYDIQLKLEFNSIKGRWWVKCLIISIFLLHAFTFFFNFHDCFVFAELILFLDVLSFVISFKWQITVLYDYQSQFLQFPTITDILNPSLCFFLITFMIVLFLPN